MVNSRLMWFLESEGALSPLQCGFRSNHSTLDHLVRFESFIRNAFVNKEHVLVIFFDLEKAYDTTWKHGILSDLADLGVKGHLPEFIKGFLSNRLFRVRVGSTFSECYEQEMGVPQGSILSPLLFNIKINNIIKSVLQGNDSSLFVDDFALIVRGKSLARVEREMQLCVNSVHKWVVENGFKFSTTKTQCIHFHNFRDTFPDPEIFLGKDRIQAVKEAKFLGLIFDQKLAFLPHILNLKLSCQKSLDILRVVGHTDWGADRSVLLRLYRALIRSKLDYGCIVYGSARKSYLEKLDTIHHQGLRICLGAFRTSPVKSLYVEAGEPSLHLRRLKLSLNYVIKLKSLPENPAYSCVLNPQYITKYAANPSVTPPLGIRMKEVLESANINLNPVSDEFPLTDSPPWTFSSPTVRFDLCQFRKEDTNPAIYQQYFCELCTDYPAYTRIFTDGSKTDHKVAAAAVSNQDFTNPFQIRLPDDSSIYTAESVAIYMALKHIYQSQEDSFLILSDSLSVLTSIQKQNLDHPFLRKVQELHSELIQDGKSIVFVWVPGHAGITGNTFADAAAKRALNEPVSNIFIPYSDLRPCVHSYIQKVWQEFWDLTPSNKFFQIQPKLDSPVPRYFGNRKRETIFSRLHIGHSYFSHSFLLRGEDPPYCTACDTPYTVEHVLISCVDLLEIRQKYYSVDSLFRLFREVCPDLIFAFLKEINLFDKI